MGDPTIDQAKGDIKNAAGKVTGDRDLEAQGKAESTVAGVRKDAGNMVDQARDVAGDVADKTRDAAGDIADTAGDMARKAGDKVDEVMSR
jgi:uncharacterized protein YjbJ (UPF0337 family)